MRAKKKAKRLANPTRNGYSSILNNATASGSGDFHTLARKALGEADGGEAMAVARAIGLNQNAFGERRALERESEGVPLARMKAVKSYIDIEDSPSPDGPLAMDDVELEELPDQMEAWGTPDISTAGDDIEKSESVGETETEMETKMEKLDLAD